LFALLALSILGGCATGEYIPKPNEELYGTWINEQNGGNIFLPQGVVFTADGYKLYCSLSDSNPCEVGTSWIDSKWTDSEGNIWYRTFGTNTAGVYKGDSWQEL